MNCLKNKHLQNKTYQKVHIIGIFNIISSTLGGIGDSTRNKWLHF